MHSLGKAWVDGFFELLQTDVLARFVIYPGVVFCFDKGNEHLLSGNGIWVADFDDDANVGWVYLADLVFDFLNFDPYAPDLRLL